jgi:NAD-dependent deacetylase
MPVKKEILKVQPNEAHFALDFLQKNYAGKVKIYTSNIDNLLEQADCSHLIHVHVDTQHMNCLDCNHTWNIGNQPYNLSDTCHKCLSTRIKPAIIFFNENAPRYKSILNDFKNSDKIVKKISCLILNYSLALHLKLSTYMP